MVTLENAVIARYEKEGNHFEVLVDPESAMAFREGNKETLDLATDEIFKDSKKGDRASLEVLKKIFQTGDPIEIAKIIVKKGNIQLTTEQRRKMAEEKRKQVITTIARNAINPQTNTPHPPTRIELAMDEAGVHIDPFKSVEEQVNEVLDALKPLIPIRFEKVKIAVKIPAEYTGQVYGELHRIGRLLKEDWLKDGSWAGLFEIPAGMQPDFYGLINRKTHGNAITKIVENLK
ncbi:MAG: ribosome assembly factor SBDS [Thermoplasmata archaeon]|nr:ribosome assembly factor SBDS [Thermoplasmata archaeon]